VKVLLYILLFTSLGSSGQMFTRYHAVTLPLNALGGAAYYHQEVLRNQYYKFQAVWPEANPDTWNPLYSWENKYKNHDYTQGPAFPGSTTFLVAFTDPYHAFFTLGKAALVATPPLMLWGVNKHKIQVPPKPFFYFKEFVLHSLSYSIGFTMCDVIYSTIYKNKLQ